MNVDLRIISTDDWQDFRTIRLQALADSPDSFGMTLAEAAAQTPDVWRDRAAGSGPVVLAYTAQGPVAMGGLYVPDGSPDAFVWGMWVEPGSRGHGLGARVLQRLLEHAEAAGLPVTLHVTEGNDVARRLYERHGFTATGGMEPLREGSNVRILAMRRA